MSPEQLAWLEATLEASRDRRHVFVFLHHPRWIGGRYGDDWERVHEVLAVRGTCGRSSPDTSTTCDTTDAATGSST